MVIHQKFADAKKIEINVDARQILKSDSSEIILITLKTDEEIPVHDNPFDVSFVALEGNAILTLDGKRLDVNPFDTLSIPSGHQRGLKNIESKDFKVAVIKKLK